MGLHRGDLPEGNFGDFKPFWPNSGKWAIFGPQSGFWGPQDPILGFRQKSILPFWSFCVSRDRLVPKWLFGPLGCGGFRGHFRALFRGGYFLALFGPEGSILGLLLGSGTASGVPGAQEGGSGGSATRSAEGAILGLGDPDQIQTSEVQTSELRTLEVRLLGAALSTDKAKVGRSA